MPAQEDTMAPAITLRPIDERDVEFLLDLYGSTRNDILEGPLNCDQQQALIRMQFDAQHQHYQSHFPDAHFDIILCGDQRIGRLYVDQTDDEIRIIDIAITPAHRGRGIGSSVVGTVMNQAVALQLPVRLRVEPYKPAARWYRRLGFRVIAEEQFNQHMQWDPPPQNE